MLRRENLLPITLVDTPRSEKVAAPPEEKSRAEIKKPAPPPPKIERVKETKPVAKKESVQPNQPAAPAIPVKEEPAKTVETKASVPSKPDIPPIPAPAARIEGGGSEAGAGNLFGKGDVGVVPGPGTAGGGGGTAASGLGRGSGAPGLPGQSVLRTNREAKPIQTVRANYPPMALRMGMESDVTLRIEVDMEGRVTKAEITKSGGAGFDEEALKAVKQSRFEPAQRDGQIVPAEFIYIYRFRLQR
jgi:protein TonB